MYSGSVPKEPLHNSRILFSKNAFHADKMSKPADTAWPLEPGIIVIALHVLHADLRCRCRFRRFQGLLNSTESSSPKIGTCTDLLQQQQVYQSVNTNRSFDLRGILGHFEVAGFSDYRNGI
jgi:hypothetical protein